MFLRSISHKKGVLINSTHFFLCETTHGSRIYKQLCTVARNSMSFNLDCQLPYYIGVN